MFLKDFFYPRTGMNYDMRLDSGLLEINFKGKFNAGEEAVLYERLNADLAMLPRDISGVKLNTSQVHKDYPDFRSIGFVLLGFCSVRKIGLEVIADAEFSKSLSKGLAGLKTGAENKPARR